MNKYLDKKPNAENIPSKMKSLVSSLFWLNIFQEK